MNKATEIQVSGYHRGTWYVIDHTTCERYGDVYLLEHDTYGDEAAGLIITSDYTVIIDDVWDGFLDLWEFIDMVEWAEEAGL